MSPSVKTAQMNQPAVARNFIPGILRAAVGVAVLWVAMHFFFAWQDGRTPSVASAEAKLISTVTTR